MSEEEIIKYAKIFSNAKGDTYKINFVNENKTIDEVEIWKEILKLIDKKDKVIEEATNYIENHKTPLGNYLMSPSEIEVLLEILRK